MKSPGRNNSEIVTQELIYIFNGLPVEILIFLCKSPSREEVKEEEEEREREIETVAAMNQRSRCYSTVHAIYTSQQTAFVKPPPKPPFRIFTLGPNIVPYMLLVRLESFMPIEKTQCYFQPIGRKPSCYGPGWSTMCRFPGD